MGGPNTRVPREPPTLRGQLGATTEKEAKVEEIKASSSGTGEHEKTKKAGKEEENKKGCFGFITKKAGKEEENKEGDSKDKEEIAEIEQNVGTAFYFFVMNLVTFILFCALCFGLANAGKAGIFIALGVTIAICFFVSLVIKLLEWEAPKKRFWSVSLCMFICACCVLPAWLMLQDIVYYYNSHEEMCVERSGDATKDVACLQQVLGTDVAVDAELIKIVAVLLHLDVVDFVRACLFLGRLSWMEVGGLLFPAVPFHLIFFGSNLARKMVADKVWTEIKKNMESADADDDDRAIAYAFIVSLKGTPYTQLRFFCADNCIRDDAAPWKEWEEDKLYQAAVQHHGKDGIQKNGNFPAIMLYCLEPTRKRIWGQGKELVELKGWIPDGWIPVISKFLPFYAETHRFFRITWTAFQALVLALIPAIVRLSKGQPALSEMPFAGQLGLVVLVQFVSNLLILFHFDTTCCRLLTLWQGLYTLRISTKDPAQYETYGRSLKQKDGKQSDDQKDEGTNPFRIFKREMKVKRCLKKLENWCKASDQFYFIASGLRTSINVDLTIIIMFTFVALLLALVNVFTGESVAQVNNQKIVESEAGQELDGLSANTDQVSDVDIAAALVLFLIARVIVQMIARIACINEEFDMQGQVLQHTYNTYIRRKNVDQIEDGQKTSSEDKEAATDGQHTSSEYQSTLEVKVMHYPEKNIKDRGGDGQKTSYDDQGAATDGQNTSSEDQLKSQIEAATSTLEVKATHHPVTVFGKKITRSLLTSYIVMAVVVAFGYVEKPAMRFVHKKCQDLTKTVSSMAISTHQDEYSSNFTNYSNTQMAGKHIDENKGVLEAMICVQVQKYMAIGLSKGKEFLTAADDAADDAARRLQATNASVVVAATGTRWLESTTALFLARPPMHS